MPWSALIYKYVRNFSGVIGRFHLLSLGSEFSSFLGQIILFLDVVSLAYLKLLDKFILLYYLFLGLANLVYYLIKFLLHL